MKTKMVFSGDSMGLENFLRARPQEFSHCGILISFAAIKTKKNREARRVKALLKNKPFVFEPKKKGKKNEDRSRGSAKPSK